MSEDPKTPTDARIRWLHLSDFHFTTQEQEGWDRRRTLKALLHFLADKKAEGWKPDFVFATGDIAWSGKEKEYDQAFHFFRELAKTLDLDLPSQLFLIPGNHDVDRGQIGPVDDFMLDGLLRGEGTEQQEQIARVLKDAPTLRLLGRRLEAYYIFTERLLGSARRTISDKPWRVDFRNAAGLEVAILQLNSALASSRNEEKGRLLVGAHQLEEALGEAERSRLRFVLIHHPYDYLADGDAAAIKGRLMARGGGHFFLRGHLHATTIELAKNPDGKLIELAAGAVYAGTQLPKRFLIGEADLRKGKALVESFTYSDAGAGFWKADSLAYEKARNGRVTLALPSDLKLGPDPVEVGGKKGKKAHSRTVFTRYRAAVAAVHGQMRFIGFPAAATGHRPNVGVQELFVPLRLAAAGRGETEKKQELSTKGLLTLLAPGQKKASRFVVLGEPGSGKTTLCRFAAVAFSGAAGATPGAPEGTLPLFLPFRDYVRQCREFGDCSLLDYLVGQARQHLQVGAIDAEMLEAALSGGEAVLFLDGLDEVGSELERTKMRDRILAFCEQYPNLPALLTSRHTGYDLAPLPEKTFHQLHLKPFEDEDLIIFVGNWYAVQEPNDPLARERGVADLTAALTTTPRIRVLVGNPLLATLIALVHRTEVKLPGERSKLYELCARTLLETWPHQAQRQFLEIDEGLQRTYLEEFALRQQHKRASPLGEVAFDQNELVSSLAEIIARKETQTPIEIIRRQAERWVEYLAAGTGIIVEQRPGIFGFIHLSILEFLAACALDRQGGALEIQIAKLHKRPIWREVLLLAVGRRATDISFLERLFSELHQSEGEFFLLYCLREEAAFGDAQLTGILDRAARALLRDSPIHWASVEGVVRSMERFSVRHKTAVATWRRKHLRESCGENLRSVVALSFGQPTEIEFLLSQRPDRAKAASDLLEFWPGSNIGSWALGETPPLAILGLSAKAPPDLAIVRAIAAVAGKVPFWIGAAVAPLQLRAASYYDHLAVNAGSRLNSVEKINGSGLPRNVIVPGVSALKTMPRWPQRSSVSELGRNSDFTRNISRDFARDIARDFIRDFVRDFALDFSRDFVRDFARDLSRGFSRYFVRDFGRHFSQHSVRYFARYFARDFTQYFSLDLIRHFARGFALDFAWTNSDVELSTPDRFDPGLDRTSFEAFRAKPGEGSMRAAYLATTSRRAAEAWIALSTTSRGSREEAWAYLTHRLQNVATLYLWPALDHLLPLEPEPERLALYLQIGWTQSTTTYEWPGTERWIALMKAGPPAHWLPRVQWHLCWLLHDPDDAEHRRSYNETLREGLADGDICRQAVAVTLEQVIGFYP